jgi:hypothetical protein
MQVLRFAYFCLYFGRMNAIYVQTCKGKQYTTKQML